MRWTPHSRRRARTKSETWSAIRSRYPLRRSLRVPGEEIQGAPPGVVRVPLELLLLAVEEAVRRALVDHDLVLDPGGVERRVEGVVVLDRNGGVRASLEREDRSLHPRHLLERRAPVETDGAGEPVAGGGREPRVPPAEAEADGEDRGGAVLPQVRDAGGDVGLHALGRRLLAVRPVVEVLAALLGARGAAVEVECDRGVAALGEAEGELLVEAVEAANVREDDDARRRPLPP